MHNIHQKTLTKPTNIIEQATPRKWRIFPWLLVFIFAAVFYCMRQSYLFDKALSDASYLGWQVSYTSTIDVIKADWKAIFRKETWLEKVSSVVIEQPISEEHLVVIQRLNPKGLDIANANNLEDLNDFRSLRKLNHLHLENCSALENIDGLKKLSALQSITLHYCTALSNIDALKNHTALAEVRLNDCAELTQIDGLKDLTNLQILHLTGCSSLTNIDALKNLTKSLSDLQK